MAEVAQIQEAGNAPNKRKLGHKKGNKAKKKMKVFQGNREKVKIDKRMKKIFQKRARDYNSDDEEEEPAPMVRNVKEKSREKREDFHEENEPSDDGEDRRDAGQENEPSDDEDGEILPGITKFAEGCKAFKKAFKKITKKNVSDDVLGPILSAHKKLVAEKLAEEEEVERKVKGDAKKEKHVVREKGHVKPANNYLDPHEKFLIGVATKGVKLAGFELNDLIIIQVNKAQNAQKGLNPLRSKDAKVIKKRKKEAFFSELSKMPSADSSTKADGEGPGWAPLRDNYMLTNSKLKDWDKMQDDDTSVATDDFGLSADSSSDDD
ncbi:hypothetical protein LguiA_022888 [Lonicera macranthoides]